MCMLCALHKLSQIVPAMLPWLVVPLLALWAASQLLPPPLRFELTPPRLACALFLVAVLFWYQILMPQLLTWQARRSARLLERRRHLADELQRLRREAVRRCRNCFTEYKDQNPPGGKFMCCYCGHVSKRPVFDLPGSPGIVHDLKGGWIGPNGMPADKPCARKLASFVSAAMRWIRGRFPVVGGTRGSDADGKEPGKEESRGDSAESRCEKAKRKAEEKRQARLEKELQEEEERKQREEVFKLIEEQRKLRDEKLEAVKEALRSSALDGVREGRKDSRKRRSERRKEKDVGSSKSSSDVEELERRVGRDCERKPDVEKRVESEKIGYKKSPADTSRKSYPLDTLQGARGIMDKSRCSDRVRGSSLLNAGFNGASNINKSAPISAVPSNKPCKPIGCDGSQQSSNASDKNASVSGQNPVVSDQPRPNVWKNKMHWLFKKTVAVSSAPNAIPAAMAPPNGQMTQIVDGKPLVSNNSDHTVQMLPFSSRPFMDFAVGGNVVSSASQVASESLPSVEEIFHSSMSEEGDFFEDPCYDPDPFELLGPVSESLNFPVDVGYGFATDTNMKGPGFVAKANTSVLEGVAMSTVPSHNFPISSLEIPGTKHIATTDFPSMSVAKDSRSSQIKDDTAKEHGIWHMWGPSLIPNPLGVIGGSTRWLSPIKENDNNQNIAKNLPCNPTLPSLIEGRPLSGPNSPRLHHPPKYRYGDSIAIDACLTDSVPCIEKATFQKLSNGSENIIPLKLEGTAGESVASLDSPSKATSSVAFDPSWSKEDWTALRFGGQEDGARVVLADPCIGGLFPNDSHVQSLWSSG